MKELRLIAGPCSAESEQQVMSIASRLSQIGGISLFRAGLWKPRTSPYSFEGVGKQGIKWLMRAQNEIGIPVCTEVATTEHAVLCLEAGIRHLWIGARTTSNPFLVEEIAQVLEGRSDIEVLVKNPINPDLDLWIGAIERFKKRGITCITAVHRGFSTDLPQENGYRMSPCWSIPFELKRLIPSMPLIMDPSHLAGMSNYISSLSIQAIELGYDGLMVECHTTPNQALSDSKQQITPVDLQQLWQSLPRYEQTDANGLAPLRSQIDEIDDQLWQLIVRRQRVSKLIGDYKREHHMPILQANRYDSILRHRLQWADQNGLSADAVHKILEAIHEESIRVQLHDK